MDKSKSAVYSFLHTFVISRYEKHLVNRCKKRKRRRMESRPFDAAFAWLDETEVKEIPFVFMERESRPAIFPGFLGF